ncbi:MAG: type II toxin-antitoxin system VapC family toxin [Methylococcales bacterium]|nr:type II toxin-antitoxin system VapC family toxin [Methylococcales bacterium]
MKYVLDTNIVIYLQKGVLVEPLPIAEYGISIITEMELRSYPALTIQQRHWLMSFINDIHVFELNNAIKEKTIELRQHYRLKLPDAIVCATAMASQAILLSNDKGLQHIDGLRCQLLAVVL